MSGDLCPWLGTAEDKELHYAQPSQAHVCYARRRPAAVKLDNQEKLCFTAEHAKCRLYRQPSAPALPVFPVAAEPESAEEEDSDGRRRFPLLWVGLWAVAILVAAAVVYFYLPLLNKSARSVSPSRVVVSGRQSPTCTVTATPSPTPSPDARLATESPPTVDLVAPSFTPTPYPGGALFNLAPAETAAGWVASDEVAGNHLGDSYLYSGVFDGVVYHGILQFDLSAVPRGATIHAAVLELVGLDGRRLNQNGSWEVRLLDRNADGDWSRTTYQAIHNATVQWTAGAPIGVVDLSLGRTNAFGLPSEALKDLERRLIDEHYAVSFRIDGPLTGDNSVFAWDSGSGAATRGDRPRLFLSVGPAPDTPVPSGTPEIVVVTSTPTPANVLTAAVLAHTATAVALTTGQPTPTSAYEWTATPAQIVTNTPTPANQATAQYYSALATAIAFTTGTYTPTPAYLMTATPTPMLIPVGQLTPTPTPLPASPIPPVPVALRGKILYHSDRAGFAGPWAMEADGSGVALLTAAWPYQAALGQEDRSPDGRQMVYAGTTQGRPAILVRPVKGGNARPLVVFDQGHLSVPVWSPDGSRIAFVGSLGGDDQVWLVYADGTGPRMLTNSRWGAASHPSFSPDGKLVAYAGADPEGRRQIWVIDVYGLNRRNLSSNEYDESDPLWIK